jgi:UDP-N-acetylglucosamine--N-acetylmuramyl-(pentapeptide) pyrophosphoryl-undecaprenol N-acetylglucosamine transferase
MHQRVTVTGTPVRPEFEPHDAQAARMAMGLAPDRPVLLVMGGSQGATGVNHLIIGALPILRAAAPELQILHLTGAGDYEKVRQVYRDLAIHAVVRPFLSEMELGLGAASVAVSRAGASSLAELAAMQLPAVLIPYPTAADDHQTVNAREYERTGAARVLPQASATSQELATTILELLRNPPVRARMQQALAAWHHPDAADQIAQRILSEAGIETQPVSMKAACLQEEALKNELLHA